MVLFGGAFGLLALAVWIFCIVDSITTPADQVRNLPKLAWILVIVLAVDFGSIAWLVAGRPWSKRPVQRSAQTGGLGGAVRGSGSGTGPGFGGLSAQSRRAPARATNPDDDEEFLATLKLRADEQRRRAREAGEQPDDPGSSPA